MEKKIFVTKSVMPPYSEYIEAIKPLWDTHILTNMGTYHRQLEEKLKDYLDVEELSLMVNGHISLEMAIQMMNFPEGSEVITTPFTFISTTHAIVRNHLIPIFCDVKLEDGTIDETKIEKLITAKTVAILPVHVYGNICNIEEIQRIAEKHRLKVIYDAAHAFGVKYNGKGIGAYGDASIFSFHATKIFNTIEGGAVTFSKKDYYEKLYNLKNFGIRGEELVVDVGANAKMNEFCAIMGLCNLNHINETISGRKERYNYYKDRIEQIKGIELISQEENIEKNYAYLPIRVDTDYPLQRDQLYNKYANNNICARKYFYPLTSEQECYKNNYANINLPMAKKLSATVLTLPLWDDINYEDIEQILTILCEE